MRKITLPEFDAGFDPLASRKRKLEDKEDGKEEEFKSEEGGKEVKFAGVYIFS